MTPTSTRLAALALAGLGGAAIAGPAAGATKTVTLKSASVNAAAGTATLPLERGTSADGAPVWYVITDSSDKADASRRGVNWAPRLARAAGTKAVQTVSEGPDGLRFPGTVDFSPTGAVVPGAQGFPPAKAVPGAVGDARYSPFVTTGGGVVLNAPQVKNASGLSGSVVRISPDGKRVTLRLLGGFFAGKRVLYLRTDASVGLVAALESSTFAPNLNAVPGTGSDAQSSGRSAIVPVVNGPRGAGNPDRQGLQSAVLGQGAPLNITQSFPNAADYSPAWDVTPVVWTAAAIRAGERTRLTSTAAVDAAARRGELTSLGTGPRNASLGGIRALGGISNCTTVAILS
jgi:hypothetical protein